MSNKHPLDTFSNTIAIFGGLVETPISITMFGCLKIDSILTSFVISDKRSSVITGSKMIFIATSVPRQIPLYITLKPPYPILSPSESS